MKLFALFLSLASLSLAQTPTGTVTSVSTPVPSLPSTLAGGALSWQRGAAYPLQEQTIYAKNFTTTAGNQKLSTPWFLYFTASTPITPTPAGGTPIASTLGGGACYVAAQSSSASLMLLLCATGGLSATQASAGGQFNGNVAFAKRVGKTHWYLTGGIGGSSIVGGSSSGTFIAQPFFGTLYGWGGN